jgi:hypothetical protein
MEAFRRLDYCTRAFAEAQYVSFAIWMCRSLGMWGTLVDKVALRWIEWHIGAPPFHYIQEMPDNFCIR